ncbi:MAG: DNA repair protein RecO [Rhodospirillales bacterium]
MQWSDDALVLAARRLGESQAIVSLLAAGHGRWQGVVPGGNSRGRRPLLQQGTRVVATWRARHAGQLGTVTCEAIAAVPALILADRLRLAALTAAAALIDALLPEREPNAPIYDASLALLAALGRDDDWLAAYVRWETLFLAEIGFGHDDAGGSGSVGADEAIRLAATKTGLARNASRLEDRAFAAAGGRMPFARAHFGRLVAELR